MTHEQDEMRKGEWYTIAKFHNYSDFCYLNPNEFEHNPCDDRYTFKTIEEAIEFRNDLDVPSDYLIMHETISVLDV
jgi:hypothetical protein